jgi:threonine dehydratase
MNTSVDLVAIKKLRSALDDYIVNTPMVRCYDLEQRFSRNTKIFAKMEFFQHTGTFKLRGALTSLLGLNKNQQKNGVTAVSAGNHAIAIAYASRVLGINAKVVMPKSSNIFRIESCRKLGAEVVFADDATAAFKKVEIIKQKENRAFIHPFEGINIIHGTATLGYEICEQNSEMDAVIVPIGGGGLCAGLSSYVRGRLPSAEIYGVEPQYANSINMSIKENRPKKNIHLNTIADSLAAPFAMPISFEFCRDNLTQSLLVSENEIANSMNLLFNEMKLAVEPACAVSTAALLGPLNEKLDGKKVVLIMCGSNIDWSTFRRNLNFRA